MDLTHWLQQGVGRLSIPQRPEFPTPVAPSQIARPHPCVNKPKLWPWIVFKTLVWLIDRLQKKHTWGTNGRAGLASTAARLPCTKAPCAKFSLGAEIDGKTRTWVFPKIPRRTREDWRDLPFPSVCSPRIFQICFFGVAADLVRIKQFMSNALRYFSN